jgi:gliding motility-associated-like protein
VEVILPQIQVPNVFTPNGDGFNDAFRIIAQGIATSKLVIYDRWGVLIYEGNVPVWNGNTRNGQPAAEGVYYYLYEATSIDGRSFTDRGSVTLVR